jgi:hypothetical protein
MDQLHASPEADFDDKSDEKFPLIKCPRELKLPSGLGATSLAFLHVSNIV